MSDPIVKTLPQLTAAGAISDSDLLPIYQGASPLKRTTAGAISSYVVDEITGQPVVRDDAYALRNDTPRVFDNFDDDDQILNGRVCPTGQTWSVSGPGANIASITDGVLVNNGANFYASLQYGELVPALGGVISFIPGSAPTGVDGPQCVLIAQRSTLNLAEMIHCEFTPDSWSLKYWHDGAVGVAVAGGTYNIRTDGYPYPVGMEIDGDNVTIIDPRGVRTLCTNALFSDIAPTAGTIQVQVTGAGSDYVGRWHEFYMGLRNPSSLAVLNGAAGQGDMRTLMGNTYTEMKAPVQFTATSNGSYRILNAGTPSNFAITGVLNIYAKAANGNYVAYSAFVSGQHDSGDPIITELNRTTRGSPISVITVSAGSGGPNNVAIDLTIPAAASSNVDVRFEWRGFGETVLFPVTGAVPLTRTQSTVNLTTAPPTPPTNATLSTNGSYRIAKGSTLSGFSMVGVCRIQAFDAAGRVTFATVAFGGRRDTGITMQVTDCEILQGGAITEITLSRDSATASIEGMGLDITCPNATTNAVTLYVDWGSSSLTSVASPVVGATPLATESQVIVLSNGRAKTRQSTLGSYATEDVVYTTLTNGGTYAIGQNVPGIQNLSGTIAATTITLPDSPFNGQIVQVGTVGEITALTLNASATPGGQTLSNAPTTLLAGNNFAMRYNSSTSVWYRHQ